MNKRRLAALLVILICMTALPGGCSEAEEAPPPEDTVIAEVEEPVETQPEPEPETEPAPEEDTGEFVPDGNINPLTGLCDGISDQALNRRPVAIMVSNSYDSLPQWGISQADIIYEMYAEGRITRFLAIFQDPGKIEKLASVRSARPYFIDIAQSYGAVYLHFGGSVPAYNAISARSDLVSIDGIKGSWEGTLFHRDPDRRKQIGYEHSVYTTGEYLEAALAKLNQSLELEDSPSAFPFSMDHSHSALGGEASSNVTIAYSGTNKPWFEYDSETGTWLRFQYGGPHMDAWMETQLAVKNLLVIRMSLTDVAGSSLKLVEVGTTGKGTGYYFCDGKYIEITWEKQGYNTPITFYDQEGNPVVFARGNTFVAVTSTTANVVIES